MADEYHALASPSGAHRWMACANSLAMAKDQPNASSKSADLGTDKHELYALCLEYGKDAMSYEGHVLGKGHTVNKELATDVQTVVDNVRARIRGYLLQGCDVGIHVEQDIPIGHITGEEGATGRVDTALIVSWPDSGTWLDIIDAKFGFQPVSATENPQLMLYAAGGLEKFGLLEEFVKVNMAIEQPMGECSEWSQTPEQIEIWARDQVTPAARKAIDIYKSGIIMPENFAPAEKTCQWCLAKATCPALAQKVVDTIGADFDEVEALDTSAITVEKLGEIFPNLELVEDWIKAVRARIEFEVFAGRTVPGVKVVAGKRGNRQWADESQAEAMMKKFQMKSDEMYAKKLLGPKPILDALKDSPRRLKQIEALVVQAPGKNHVVVDTDPREAIVVKPTDDGFEAADENESLC